MAIANCWNKLKQPVLMSGYRMAAAWINWIAEQRERYLQASADCQSSAPAGGIVYELFVAGKGKTFTAKPKPNAEIASLLAKRSSCGKDIALFLSALFARRAEYP